MSEVDFINPALKSAVALYRQPLLARKMEKSDLPQGISEVLRIAAGGSERAALAAESQGATAQELYQACLLYLQTVVFHQNAQDARLLGLSEPINREELRDHKRMILKWLHPDRNHNSWESKLFLRIQAAVARLENSKEAETSAVPMHQVRRVSPRRHYQSVESQRRLKSSDGWLNQLFSQNAIVVFFAVFVLMAGIYAVLAVAFDGHVPGLSFEVAN